MFNKINISSQRQKLIVYVILTLAALAVFRQVHQYSFINFDDIGYVTQYSNIQSGITQRISLGFQYKICRLMESARLALLYVRLSALWFECRRLSCDQSYSAYSQHIIALLAFQPHDRSHLAKRLCRGALRASPASCGIGCLDF